MEKPIQFRTAIGGFHREDVVHYLEYLNNRHSAELARLNSELTEQRAKAAEAGDCSALRSDLTRTEAELEAVRSLAEAEKERCSALEQELQEALSRSSEPDRAADPVQQPSADARELQKELEQVKTELQILRSRAEQAAGQELELAQCREKLARMTAENDELRKRNSILEAKLCTAEAAVQEKKSTANAELEIYRRAERVERLARERAYDIAARLKAGVSQAAVGPMSDAAGMTGVVERVAAELETLRTAAERLQKAYKEAAESAEALDQELRQ